jgi:hypothetical protein
MKFRSSAEPDRLPRFGSVAEEVAKVDPAGGARRGRQALHRAQRSGERSVAQRVPKRASQKRGLAEAD